MAEVNLSGAPWPLVGECHGHRGAAADWRAQTCPQCDGSHRHTWVAWKDYPLGRASGMVPVRCRECGARKCDDPRCVLRRHHRQPHDRL